MPASSRTTSMSVLRDPGAIRQASPRRMRQSVARDGPRPSTTRDLPTPAPRRQSTLSGTFGAGSGEDVQSCCSRSRPTAWRAAQAHSGAIREGAPRPQRHLVARRPLCDQLRAWFLIAPRVSAGRRNTTAAASTRVRPSWAWCVPVWGARRPWTTSLLSPIRGARANPGSCRS
jgi:hypothetical protein